MGSSIFLCDVPVSIGYYKSGHKMSNGIRYVSNACTQFGQLGPLILINDQRKSSLPLTTGARHLHFPVNFI